MQGVNAIMKKEPGDPPSIADYVVTRSYVVTAKIVAGSVQDAIDSTKGNVKFTPSRNLADVSVEHVYTGCHREGVEV